MKALNTIVYQLTTAREQIWKWLHRIKNSYSLITTKDIIGKKFIIGWLKTLLSLIQQKLMRSQNNMPKEKIDPQTEKQIDIFTQLVRAGFDPIRDMIEYGNLEDHLTKQDVSKIASAIEGSLNNWITFIKMAKKKEKLEK